MGQVRGPPRYYFSPAQHQYNQSDFAVLTTAKMVVQPGGAGRQFYVGIARCRQCNGLVSTFRVPAMYLSA